MIDQAPVTHFVKHKTHGSIHQETICKITDKPQKGIQIRGGMAKNDEYIRCDVFEITNDKHKIHYDFVVMTARHKGKEVSKLPNPLLKENEKAKFVFSVFKNDLLSYSLKDKTQILGNFSKIDNINSTKYIILQEPKNIETDFFRKQIKSIYSTFNKTDDVQELNEIIEDIKSALKLDLKSVSEIKTQTKKIKNVVESITVLIKNTYNINTIFTMEKMNSIQTKELRDILINDKTIVDNINIDNSMTKTIFISLYESGYVPSSNKNRQDKVENLKKLEINSMGEYKTITKESRKLL